MASKRCKCKDVPQRTDCGTNRYAKAVTLANGCPGWECKCNVVDEPTCVDDKRSKSTTDSNGCVEWTCECIPKTEVSPCVAPKFNKPITKPSGCIDYECVCPPHTSKTDADCQSEHDENYEAYDITDGICPTSNCRCKTPTPRTDCVSPMVSVEVAIAGSVCRKHECQCPQTAPSVCTDSNKESKTTTVNGCPSHECVCKIVPPRTDCTHPKVSVQVPIQGSDCYDQECQCPSANQPTCDDVNKYPLKSTMDECDTWTCVCKDVADPSPCPSPKVITEKPIDGSPCKTKVCECPSSSTAGDCDADQELVSTTTVTCGSTNVCQCKTIPDEPCKLPKTLKTVAVEGSTNGCTKRVCGCPSTQTADDCADDQEIKTETSDECGETRTCQCKTIADETPCVLPKVLTSVAVAGSTNGCQKKVCRCPSHSTDDDCDADQELVSTTTEVCGEIKTCQCKTIADETPCVLPTAARRRSASAQAILPMTTVTLIRSLSLPPLRCAVRSRPANARILLTRSVSLQRLSRPFRSLALPTAA